MDMLTPQQQNQLWTRIKPIKCGMLTTWNGEFLHARPMQHVNNDFEGELLYFTALHSAKADETKKYDDVCVTYADTDKSTYVSISGEAELIQDRSLIEKHWNMFVEAWFPEGKDSPEVAMLRIRPYRAEYWDAPASKMVQLFHIAKANLTHSQPNMGQNRKFG
jgi:general stress protein 26